MSSCQVNIAAAYFPLDLAKRITEAATITPKVVKDNSTSCISYILTAWGQVFSLKEGDNRIELVLWSTGPVQDIIIDDMTNIYVTTLIGNIFAVERDGTLGTDFKIENIITAGHHLQGVTCITNDGAVYDYDPDNNEPTMIDTPEPIVSQTPVNFIGMLLLGLSGRVWYYNVFESLKDTNITDIIAISHRALLRVDGRIYEITDQDENDIKFALSDNLIDGIAVNSDDSESINVFLIDRSRDIFEVIGRGGFNFLGRTDYSKVTMNVHASHKRLQYNKVSIGGKALTVGGVVLTIIRTDGRVLYNTGMVATVPRLNVFNC